MNDRREGVTVKGLTSKQLIQVVSMKAQMRLIIGLFIAIIILITAPYIILTSYSKDLGTLEAESKVNKNTCIENKIDIKIIEEKIHIIERQSDETNRVVKDIKVMLDQHIKDSKEEKDHKK